MKQTQILVLGCNFADLGTSTSSLTMTAALMSRALTPVDRLIAKSAGGAL